MTGPNDRFPPEFNFGGGERPSAANLLNAFGRAFFDGVVTIQGRSTIRCLFQALCPLTGGPLQQSVLLRLSLHFVDPEGPPFPLATDEYWFMRTTIGRKVQPERQPMVVTDSQGRFACEIGFHQGAKKTPLCVTASSAPELPLGLCMPHTPRRMIQVVASDPFWLGE